MNISREAHDELIETLEDTIQYFCDEQMRAGEPVSGQTAWAIIECFALAKQAEMEGLVASDR